MSKTLILIRHAHRDKKLGADADNGISEKGEKQVKKLVKYIQEHYLEINPLIISSPKKRCQQTIAPVAEVFKKEIEINELVGESANIEGRVRDFHKWWMQKAPEFTIVCSHGDFIPICIYMMTGARADISKCSLTEISGPTAAPYLVHLIQAPGA